MSEFFQTGPQLQNTFLHNRWLKPYLRAKIGAAIFAEVQSDLARLGANCQGPYLELAKTAEREKPQHVPFNPWGQRIDEVRMSAAWQELQNISAREGMVAIGYRRAYGEHSRLIQFAKLYLFHPSSAFFTCPLAMTDGAARVLEMHGTEEAHRTAFNRLTATDPDDFWTSGQWMTERTGGSDISETGTNVRLENGKPRLYGTKWFTSSSTSPMALALARWPDSPAGSRGLSLFLVPTRLPSGEMNSIRVLRLKDKLGTWALPTAELSLEGALATPVGEKNQGVKTVATMLNITRLYNSVCAIGQATRALEQLADYSGRRAVFGKRLNDQPLHYSTFVLEEVKTLAGFLLTFESAHLLGKEECGKASPAELEILRLLTPICKLFTARSAVQTASEVVEGFGGAGYVEDVGISVHLRDAQVFPIWEGATNVLSLDMLRAMQKTAAFAALKDDMKRRLSGIRSQRLEFFVRGVESALHELEKGLEMWGRSSEPAQLVSSRSLAFYLAKLYSFVLLLNWTDQEGETNQKVLLDWVELFSENYLDRWQPATQEDCERAQRAWQQRLDL